MGAYVASGSSACAPVRPTWLTCYALDRCTTLRSPTGQGYFDRDLRFGLAAPCEPAHISLTALARVAQWTGVYALVLVALALTGILAILSSMSFFSARRPHLPLMTPVTPKL